MSYEILFLCGLIVVFIMSFCGLLQKVKETYNFEQRATEQIRSQRTTTRINSNSPRTIQAGSTSIYTIENGVGVDERHFYPPPNYSDIFMDEKPPSYEEVIKNERERY